MGMASMSMGAPAVLFIHLHITMRSSTRAVMTFGSFRDYKLKLLWDSWDITEEWQFCLSWLAVFLAVVLYHGLHYVVFSLEVALAIATLI